jgi:ribonuclease BN (tRNA processing enzyme)
MDHIQGLGFFTPLDQPGRDVHIWAPPSTTLDLRRRLSRYLSPPLFPVRIRELPCRLTLHDAPLERFRIGRFEIEASLVCHPGSTVGYRIGEDGTTLAYLPDHELALGAASFPAEPDWTSGFELASGADLLIHDAQYTEVEYRQRVGWGHSTIDQALHFAAAAGVKRLVTFHHDPGHGDAMLDRLIEEASRARGLPFELIPGTEGLGFEL